ncbi:MSHA biogenesis protein MshP [Vibrio pelagius]|uniref:MSHA biogenesis protein MshP n=1 Tax=Vibrio pelagius TaxID=28169 RepID=UPI0021C4AB66|nr:MSHA biogenesis protein MshP [Vibrio pelagius]
MMRLSTTRRKQQGSGLILVIFMLVVVIGLVGFVANRNQERDSAQLLASVIGARAEMAARSGAQIEISRFYQTDNTGSCHLGAPQTINYNGDGLDQCSVTVMCNGIGVMDTGAVVRQLVSTGQCTVGQWTLQRVIRVGLRDD